MEWSGIWIESRLLCPVRLLEASCFSSPYGGDSPRSLQQAPLPTPIPYLAKGAKTLTAFSIPVVSVIFGSPVLTLPHLL